VVRASMFAPDPSCTASRRASITSAMAASVRVVARADGAAPVRSEAFSLHRGLLGRIAHRRRSRLGWAENLQAKGLWPPSGLIAHVGFGPDGEMRVSEVWEVPREA
jgi:hypothetical protein